MAFRLTQYMRRLLYDGAYEHSREDSDHLALERIGADALGQNVLRPFLRREQAVVAVVAAAFDGCGGNVVPRGFVRDELERFLERLGDVLGGMLPHVSRWNPVRQPNGEQSM